MSLISSYGNVWPPIVWKIDAFLTWGCNIVCTWWKECFRLKNCLMKPLNAVWILTGQLFYVKKKTLFNNFFGYKYTNRRLKNNNFNRTKNYVKQKKSYPKMTWDFSESGGVSMNPKCIFCSFCLHRVNDWLDTDVWAVTITKT